MEHCSIRIGSQRLQETLIERRNHLLTEEQRELPAIMVLGFNIFLTRNNGFHLLAGSRARGVFPLLLRMTFCTSAVDNGGGGIQAAADDLKLVCEKDEGLAKMAVKKESDLRGKLKSGFLTFQDTVKKNPSLYGPLKEGQSPKFMVFACSDSRVCPSHVLDFKPGEAFVVRNIANIVPPYDQTLHTCEGAALQYAVMHLKVETIFVMGHSRCGGIVGLMSKDGVKPGSVHLLMPWLRICASAVEKVKRDHKHLSPEEQCLLCEKEAVNVSLANLLTYPFVRDAVLEKALLLKGGHYDFVDGRFQVWNLDFHINIPETVGWFIGRHKTLFCSSMIY
ncbi:Carbonic anhydrase [Linum grandiflorum]